MQRWELVAIGLITLLGSLWILGPASSSYWERVVSITGILLFVFGGLEIIFRGLDRISVLQKYIGKNGIENSTLRFWIEGSFVVITLLFILPIVAFIAATFK